MANSMKSPFRPLRLKIPFLLDIVIVSDPDQIRKIEASGDVDRLHANGTAALPFWVKFFFRATRFWDSERDLWFMSLESSANPGLDRRRAYLRSRIDKRYSDNDVRHIAELLKGNAPDEQLESEIAQIVNRRFFDEDVPLPVIRAAKHSLQKFHETALPWKYMRARSSLKKVMNYCEHALGSDVHLVDVAHNIGETVQTTALALRRLRDNLDKPVEEIFTQHALTPEVPRLATKSSRLGGMLLIPTVPGRTIFILRIEKAAAKTNDILFTFGAGSERRSCLFKEFFLQFMKDLQKALRESTPASSASG